MKDHNLAFQRSQILAKVNGFADTKFEKYKINSIVNYGQRLASTPNQSVVMKITCMRAQKISKPIKFNKHLLRSTNHSNLTITRPSTDWKNPGSTKMRPISTTYNSPKYLNLSPKQNLTLENPKNTHTTTKRSLSPDFGIHLFPIKKNTMCIHNRHRTLSTTKMFIKSIQHNISRLKRNREFWKPTIKICKKAVKKKRTVPAKPRKKPDKIFTEEEVLNLPFNETRAKLEGEILRKNFKNWDDQNSVRIQKVFRGYMMRKYYFKRMQERMIRNFREDKCARVIQREWKIFNFQRQMKRDAKERRDIACTRIQKFMRGFSVFNSCGAQRTMASMAALQKSLRSTSRRNRAAKIIQKRFRKIRSRMRKKNNKSLLEQQRLEERLAALKKPKSDGRIKIVNRGGTIIRIDVDEERRRILKRKERLRINSKKNKKKKHD
ncbi:unnamed protein product [Moneuplotes crassus]|uniref:Uncharacterized protein n=1 Tax=Euplotes crassus TaxID=5936 RepID=A0AAD1UBV3_EUPCR|nr:unnamed protein product [Moneuplotes crassus]